MNFKFLDENKGYIGIPELLVVVAIIAILTLVALINYPAARKQLALQRSASQLAQDIRRVQEMALAAEEFPDCTNPNYRYGYGVYFHMTNPKEYILFADCNGNENYNSGVDKMVGGGILKFEQGIEVNTLSPSPLSVIFTPPDPIVKIIGDNNLGEIVLINNQGQTKTIKVSKAGLIYVE